MSLMEETEEQGIDRLLREMGIWLPEIELADEDPLPPMLSIGAETVTPTDEISEWLPPPFSS
jgi:hypothetical protein